MKVTVTTLGDAIFTLEVSEDMELENFKALCEFESNIPAADIAILWNGRPLNDNKRKLQDYGIKDGEILLLQRVQRSSGPGSNPFSLDFGSIQVPGGSQPGPTTSQAGTGTAPSHAAGRPQDDPYTLRELLLSSPHDLAILKERNPPLAEALTSGSLEKFTEVLKKQQEERASKERDRLRLLTADPFSSEAQQQIAEEIRLKNVESNMETAMEFSPESFGQVHMLYIDCTVNGHPVKAFVDSGAQMTIMSQACAERCGIKRLVDTRWAGVAKGVGTQKIIGRVHLCMIQIGPDCLQSSFSILEEQPMDMLLGLDMLKRHQCIIDLKKSALIIGTTGTETPFLSESEIPEHAKLNIKDHAMTQDEDRDLAEALSKSAESGAATPGPSSASSPSAGAQTSFPDEHMQRVMSFGFSRAQAEEALQKSNGNLDSAISSLLASSFQMPR